jgi:hypothetical protein
VVASGEEKNGLGSRWGPTTLNEVFDSKLCSCGTLIKTKLKHKDTASNSYEKKRRKEKERAKGKQIWWYWGLNSEPLAF